MSKKIGLERKLVISFLLAAMIPILIQYAVNFKIMYMQSDNMRNERYNLVCQNLNNVIDGIKRQQQLLNIDYSHWSDTYNSTLNNDTKWFEDIFNNIVSDKISIDMIYVLNNNKDVVYKYNPIAGFISEYNHYFDSVRMGNEYSGLMSLNNKLYIVSFSCIKDMEGTNTIGGVLVLGQALTKDMIESLPKAYDFDIDIVSDGNRIKNQNTVDNYAQLLGMKSEQLEKNEDIRYYKIHDFEGKAIALWEVKETGDSIKEALSKTQQGSLVIIFATLVITVAFVVLLKNNIMGPIRELRVKVSHMRSNSKDESCEIDEIAALSEEFEDMSKEIVRHTSEIEEQNKALQYLVYRDDITGAYNKRFFRMKLQEEFYAAVSQSKTLCLALIYIDYFSKYRELISFNERNNALIEIYSSINNRLKNNCYICFDGADEFRVIMLDSQYKEAIDAISEIAAEISRKKFVNMEQLPNGRITVSCGVANYPKDEVDIDKLYYAARDRLHRTKHHNQGKVGYFYSIFSDIKNDIETDRKTLICASKAFLAVIDAMDEYTYTHTEGVVKYASIIAEELKLDSKAKDDIRIGALLHDIGKLELGRELLNKKNSLTEEEIQLIKQHPIFGVNMLKTLQHFEAVADIVKYHHERYDGNGYPEGLIKDDIPLGARIVAIADSFDAMTTSRAYRSMHKSFEEAVEELVKCSSKQFDPKIVEVFINYININGYNFNIIE